MFFHSPCLGSVRSLGTLGYFWVFGRDVDVVDVLLAPSKSRWCQSRIQTGNSKSSPHDLNLRVFEFCMVVFLCFLHFFNVFLFFVFSVFPGFSVFAFSTSDDRTLCHMNLELGAQLREKYSEEEAGT